MKLILKDKQEIEISNTNINYNTNLSEDERRSITFVLDEPTLTTENLIKMLTRENLEHVEINSAAKTIEKENNRVPMKLDNVYIVKNVEIPLTIVECGFLSNEQEEQQLQDDKYQDKLAWGIYNGIINYFYE